MSELNAICDPDPPDNGVAFRQQANLNQAAFVDAHPGLRWLITSNLTPDELREVYLRQGRTLAQWAALTRRLKIVDAGSTAIPDANIASRDPARLAATLTGLIPGAPNGLPFPRQASPARGFRGFGAARSRSRSGDRRRRRFSL